MLTGQLWGVATTTLQIALKVELNTTLFAKTLLRKDVATSSSSLNASTEENGRAGQPLSAEASASAATAPAQDDAAATVDDAVKAAEAKNAEENDFSSKSQIMTLMTTDVDRVGDFAYARSLQASMRGFVLLALSGLLTLLRP